MGFNLTFANQFLKDLYLEMVNEALAGKELKTAEEYAEEVLEKLDLSR